MLPSRENSTVINGLLHDPTIDCASGRALFNPGHCIGGEQIGFGNVNLKRCNFRVLGGDCLFQRDDFICQLIVSAPAHHAGTQLLPDLR